MLAKVFEVLPVIVAPFIVLVWSLVSAYVLRFGMKRSGIGLDYILFTILVVIALIFGGAI